MIIDKIGSVEPVKDLQNTRQAKRTAKLDTADSISLSPEAQKMSEIYLAMETAKAAPDIREDKVAEVIKKFQDPNYIDSVLELTADKILQSVGV